MVYYTTCHMISDGLKRNGLNPDRIYKGIGVNLVAFACQYSLENDCDGHPYVTRGVDSFFSMALQIGIIDALPEKDRSQGISLYSLFSYIPGIIGPILALGIWQGGMDYFTVVMIAIAITTGVFGYSTKMEKERINLLQLKMSKE